MLASRHRRSAAASRLAAVALAAVGATLALLAAEPGTASAQTVGQLARADDMATLRKIDVPAAWSLSKGAGVTVAVLDTGVLPTTPDLTGQVTSGPDYTKGANPAGYQPPHEHGTYIGSIIAGHGSGPGRADGVIGVAPDAKLLSVRVILDDQEPGFFVFNENASYDDTIASGIRYAVAHGAQVINMSLGSTEATRSVRQALAAAIARNVVVVAAAGNDGTRGHAFTTYSYPASFTGVISVAAVGANGLRASFSDRNSSVVVSAPGVNVVGDGPGGNFLSGDGTSPASAFVAGVAALIRSRYPALAPVQVMQAIVSSTRRRPPGGYSTGVGFGEVDAAAALRAAGQLAQPGHAGGLAGSARFGKTTRPIAVVHRDHPLIARLTIAAGVAAAGFVVLMTALIVLLRRRRPNRLMPPAAPPPAAPPPVAPPPAFPPGQPAGP